MPLNSTMLLRFLSGRNYRLFNNHAGRAAALTLVYTLLSVENTFPSLFIGKFLEPIVRWISEAEAKKPPAFLSKYVAVPTGSLSGNRVTFMCGA